MNDTALDHKQLLNNYTQTLLFSNNYKELYEAVHGLHHVFGNIVNIKAGDLTDEDIMLPHGKAISPIGAAHCLLEVERTRIFLRGIYQALLQLQQRVKGRSIHILYAGCGPYATLLTPMVAMFGPNQVTFSLLDINEASLNSARHLYETLGLTAYVKEYILTDATTYQINAGTQTDMIVSETMLNALRREPMVAVMNNLMPQLGQGGVFIPEEITVDAFLLNNAEETTRVTIAGYQPKRIKLGNVYTIGQHHKKQVAVTLPVQAVDKHRSLYLMTEIKVFGDEILSDYTCSLTMPFFVTTVEEPQTANAIAFEYVQGTDPYFKYSFLNR